MRVGESVRLREWVMAGALWLLMGCAPEVGSASWCKMMDEKPKDDWSTNEASDYTRHCIF